MRAYFLSFGLFLAIFEISVAWQSYEDSRPFVDFSYTQYLMESGTWKPSGDQLVISTSGEERQSFEFPKACRLKS